jgi:hypothetical protein
LLKSAFANWRSGFVMAYSSEGCAYLGRGDFRPAVDRGIQCAQCRHGHQRGAFLRRIADKIREALATFAASRAGKFAARRMA